MRWPCNRWRAGWGATKGSFYWHFSSRDDLLRATLDRWLEVATDDVIAAVEASSGDPSEKLRILLARVIAGSTQYPGQLQMYAAATAGQPIVQAALTRATARRIDYVASLLRANRISSRTAQRRATLAYATYLGHAQLARSSPTLLPESAAAQRALLRELIGTLLA